MQSCMPQRPRMKVTIEYERANLIDPKDRFIIFLGLMIVHRFPNENEHLISNEF